MNAIRPKDIFVGVGEVAGGEGVFVRGADDDYLPDIILIRPGDNFFWSRTKIISIMDVAMAIY